MLQLQQQQQQRHALLATAGAQVYCHIVAAAAAKSIKAAAAPATASTPAAAPAVASMPTAAPAVASLPPAASFLGNSAAEPASFKAGNACCIAMNAAGSPVITGPLGVLLRLSVRIPMKRKVATVEIPSQKATPQCGARLLPYVISRVLARAAGMQESRCGSVAPQPLPAQQLHRKCARSLALSTASFSLPAGAVASAVPTAAGLQIFFADAPLLVVGGSGGCAAKVANVLHAPAAGAAAAPILPPAATEIKPTAAAAVPSLAFGACTPAASTVVWVRAHPTALTSTAKASAAVSVVAAVWGAAASAAASAIAAGSRIAAALLCGVATSEATSQGARAFAGFAAAAGTRRQARATASTDFSAAFVMLPFFDSSRGSELQQTATTALARCLYGTTQHEVSPALLHIRQRRSERSPSESHSIRAIHRSGSSGLSRKGAPQKSELFFQTGCLKSHAAHYLSSQSSCMRCQRQRSLRWLSSFDASASSLCSKAAPCSGAVEPAVTLVAAAFTTPPAVAAARTAPAAVAAAAADAAAAGATGSPAHAAAAALLRQKRRAKSSLHACRSPLKASRFLVWWKRCCKEREDTTISSSSLLDHIRLPAARFFTISSFSQRRTCFSFQTVPRRRQQQPRTMQAGVLQQQDPSRLEKQPQQLVVIVMKKQPQQHRSREKQKEQQEQEQEQPQRREQRTEQPFGASKHSLLQQRHTAQQQQQQTVEEQSQRRGIQRTRAPQQFFPLQCVDVVKLPPRQRHRLLRSFARQLRHEQQQKRHQHQQKHCSTSAADQQIQVVLLPQQKGLRMDCQQQLSRLALQQRQHLSANSLLCVSSCMHPSSAAGTRSRWVREGNRCSCFCDVSSKSHILQEGPQFFSSAPRLSLCRRTSLPYSSAPAADAAAGTFTAAAVSPASSGRIQTYGTFKRAAEKRLPSPQPAAAVSSPARLQRICAATSALWQRDDIVVCHTSHLLAAPSACAAAPLAGIPRSVADPAAATPVAAAPAAAVRIASGIVASSAFLLSDEECSEDEEVEKQADFPPRSTGGAGVVAALTASRGNGAAGADPARYGTSRNRRVSGSAGKGRVSAVRKESTAFQCEASHAYATSAAPGGGVSCPAAVGPAAASPPVSGSVTHHLPAATTPEPAMSPDAAAGVVRGGTLVMCERASLPASSGGKTPAEFQGQRAAEAASAAAQSGERRQRMIRSCAPLAAALAINGAKGAAAACALSVSEEAAAAAASGRSERDLTAVVPSPTANLGERTDTAGDSGAAFTAAAEAACGCAAVCGSERTVNSRKTSANGTRSGVDREERGSSKASIDETEGNGSNTGRDAECSTALSSFYEEAFKSSCSSYAAAQDLTASTPHSGKANEGKVSEKCKEEIFDTAAWCGSDSSSSNFNMSVICANDVKSSFTEVSGVSVISRPGSICSIASQRHALQSMKAPVRVDAGIDNDDSPSSETAANDLLSRVSREEKGDGDTHSTGRQCALTGSFSFLYGSNGISNFLKGGNSIAAAFSSPVYKALTWEMQQLEAAMSPGKEQQGALATFLEQLQELLSTNLEACAVAAFGSAVNGFWTPYSDLDVCVQLSGAATRPLQIKALRQIAQALQPVHAYSIESRFQARVPIIHWAPRNRGSNSCSKAPKTVSLQQRQLVQQQQQQWRECLQQAALRQEKTQSQQDQQQQQPSERRGLRLHPCDDAVGRFWWQREQHSAASEARESRQHAGSADVSRRSQGQGRATKKDCTTSPFCNNSASYFTPCHASASAADLVAVSSSSEQAKLQRRSGQQQQVAETACRRVRGERVEEQEATTKHMIACDISINNVLAVVNSKLIGAYVNVDHRLRTLGYAVKWWARGRYINDRSRGTFSSFSLILMIIHFLQRHTAPPILPSLQDLAIMHRIPPVYIAGVDCRYTADKNLIKRELAYLRGGEHVPPNTQSVGELLIQFFHYFGYEYRGGVVDIRDTSSFLGLSARGCYSLAEREPQSVAYAAQQALSHGAWNRGTTAKAAAEVPATPVTRRIGREATTGGRGTSRDFKKMASRSLAAVDGFGAEDAVSCRYTDAGEAAIDGISQFENMLTTTSHAGEDTDFLVIDNPFEIGKDVCNLLPCQHQRIRHEFKRAYSMLADGISLQQVAAPDFR